MSKKTKQNGFSFVYVLVLIVCLALVGFVGHNVRQRVAINNEKNMYAEAESQIERFVNQAANLSSSKKEIEKYCSYSSAKFSKGHLGCNVEGEIHYDRMSGAQITKLISKLDNMQDQLPWKFAYDNTKNNSSTPAILSVKVYTLKTLSCGVDYEHGGRDVYGRNYDKGLLIARIGCSGPAMREYYPV